MSDPVSGMVVVASGAAMATTSVILLPGVEIGTVYGAFAGGLLFVVSSTEISMPKRIVYMAVAILLGSLGGQGMSDFLELPIRLLESKIPGVTPIQLHPGIGAAVVGAIVVYVLLALIDKAKSPEKTMSTLLRWLLPRIKK